MNDATNWKVPKWIFLISDVLLLALAYFIVWKSPHPIAKWEIIACFASAALGTVVGALPFILDYRAMGKLIEVNALGAVAEKIQNLEKLAAQISSATNQWAGVQETVQGNSDKTVAVTKEIADRMAEEIRLFSEFMKKMNDSEKATLRLEVEKLRRGELEWLQVLVTILDHVFALHAAAMRSGDVKFAAPITTFQNVCRDTARRLGLMPFAAEPDMSRSTPNATRSRAARKCRRPARSSPKPLVRVTRFRAGFCAPRSCACATGMRRRKRSLKNPLPPRHPCRKKPGTGSRSNRRSEFAIGEGRQVAAPIQSSTVVLAAKKCSQRSVTGRE
jgi:uncharacterized protein YbgA (DUF1722 family)